VDRSASKGILGNSGGVNRYESRKGVCSSLRLYARTINGSRSTAPYALWARRDSRVFIFPLSLYSSQRITAVHPSMSSINPWSIPAFSSHFLSPPLNPTLFRMCRRSILVEFRSHEHRQEGNLKESAVVSDQY